MEQQQPEGSSAGEMMVFGLIEQADRIGKSAQATQRALAKEIEELGELGAWAEAAGLELQKRADAAILELQRKTDIAIQNLEAERVQLHNTDAILQANAVRAIYDAIGKQSAGIERQTMQTLALPLRNIQQAAEQVRQNVKETKWLLLAIVFFSGLVMGLVIGYLPLRSSQNNIQEQLNRIEQSVTASQPAVPAAPDVRAPARKGKAK